MSIRCPAVLGKSTLAVLADVPQVLGGENGERRTA